MPDSRDEEFFEGPQWNQYFRMRILALPLDSEWWVKYGKAIIKPEFFDNEAEALMVELVNHFYDEYRRPPDHDEFELLVDESPAKDEVIEECLELATHIYRESDQWDLDFAEDQAIQFAREQASKIATIKNIEDIQVGKFSELERRMRDALRTGISAYDMGYSIINDPDVWAHKRVNLERVPTGMYHVDMMLGGGLGKGEIGVFMGATNMGKTRALVNTGFGAAEFYYGGNVAHVTCETGDVHVSDRYGSRITWRWLGESDSVAEYIADFRSQAARLMRGDIIVKEYPSGRLGSEELYRFIENLFIMGYHTDLVIVDSADDMALPRADKEHTRHGLNYTELRGMAGELNLALWTASQAGRAALSKLTVDLDDIAESFQKAQKADVVLAWCQTKEEMGRDMMRWFCAKNRTGDKGWYVASHLKRDSHAIITDRVLRHEEVKDYYEEYYARNGHE